MSTTGYMRPDMRPNRWKAETGERCTLCRDAEPDPELIARIERAPSQDVAGRGRGLTDGQRAALRGYARGFSYRAIGEFLAIKDMTVVSRIRDGLNNLDRVDGETVPRFTPAEDDDEIAESVTDASQGTTDPLAEDVADWILSRGEAKTVASVIDVFPELDADRLAEMHDDLRTFGVKILRLSDDRGFAYRAAA